MSSPLACLARLACHWRALVLALSLAGASWAAHAQTPASMPPLAADLLRIYQDEAFLERMAQVSFPRASAEQRSVVRRHYRATLGHPEVTTRLAGMIEDTALARFSEEERARYFAEAGLALITGGIARLDDTDIERLLRASIELMGWVPPSICKRLIVSDLSAEQVQMIERAWLGSLPPEQMEAHFAVQRRAVLAQVRGQPAPRQLSDTQVQLLEKALAGATEARWQRMPDPDTAYRAFRNVGAADAQDLCLAGRETLQAKLDLRTPLRSWALVEFAQELSR
jgi:hypothetical protein